MHSGRRGADAGVAGAAPGSGAWVSMVGALPNDETKAYLERHFGRVRRMNQSQPHVANAHFETAQGARAALEAGSFDLPGGQHIVVVDAQILGPTLLAGDTGTAPVACAPVAHLQYPWLAAVPVVGPALARVFAPTATVGQ